MITTDAFFDEIREEILKELGLAEETIYVAVAWFTEKQLFKKLLEKQGEGIKVSLVVANDEINHHSGIDYLKLKSGGGSFQYISGALMHNKFCVIDKRVVITGSYNWTNKATYQNHENITVTQNDFDLAYRFVQQFLQITGEADPDQINAVAYSKIIKRLNIIKELIALGDDEDLGYQCRRLKKEELDIEVKHILSLINEGQLDKAVRLIEQFIREKNRLTKYIDPRIPALQLEIKNLEFRILSVDEQMGEKQRILNGFATKYYEVLGDVISKILKVKERYSYLEKEKTRYHKKDYEDAKANRESFESNKKSIKENPSKELTTEEQKTLKRLHREGALICHPDKVPDELKEKASKKFRELQKAYSQQNISKVAEIVNQLRVGDWSALKKVVLTDIELLIGKREQLSDTLEERLSEFNILTSSIMYKNYEEADDVQVYLQELKVKMEEQLVFWEVRLQELEGVVENSLL